MSDADPVESAHRLAAQALATDDATAWFERLYVAAGEGRATVPWDRGGPHPLLQEWLEREGTAGAGRRALVVGSGLGEDAQLLARSGFDTTAFDVAPTAVRGALERFPGTTVKYRTANLLEPPGAWLLAFDFVLESMTVQSLPDDVRPTAIANVTRFVAHDGTLLVIATARDAADGPVQGPPWPLVRAEIDAFSAPATGLEPVRIELVGDSPPRRWRGELRRR